MKIINPYRFGGADSLLTGLVAWWPMDETSGTRVNVHNPGVHDLTDNNTVGVTTGVVGNAAAFVASADETLSCAHHADLVMGNRDFSVAGWAKFSSSSESVAIIAGKGRSSNGDGWWIRRVGITETVCGRARNADDTTYVTTTAINITYNTFFFFILQYTADVLSFEVNRGTPNTGALVGGNYALDTGVPNIGGSLLAENLDGAVDNLVIAHRIWTTDEKNRLYNSGAGMAYPG